MTDKKKTTYRYGLDKEIIFDRGFELFKQESKTGNISLNKLIDICIEKAVVEYPEEIKVLKNEIKQLYNDIDLLNIKNKKLANTIAQVKALWNNLQESEVKLNGLLKINKP